MILGVIAAFLGTMAFAAQFHVPTRYFLPCACAGALGWLVYRLLFLAQVGEMLAFGVAALLLTLLSRMLAVLLRVPVSIFLIPGIFPLVPGAGMFYLGYHLINQTHQLPSVAGQVLLTAGAIAVGITIGSAMPQRWFHRLASALGRLGRR